ncbi:hypothetical protein [Streptomyces sp. NPDC050738]|uniref:hypothetical protein n=1 Tax=Streptomyces sp. NPDC050738 TaxID=3154744 RepID=UPI003433C0F0
MAVNTYTLIHQALLRSGKTPREATGLLARLRSETGAELAAALRAHNTEQNLPSADTSHANSRRRKARYGATKLAADWIELAAASGRRFTAPHQRENRSTS